MKHNLNQPSATNTQQELVTWVPASLVTTKPSDTIRGMSRLLGNAMSLLVLHWYLLWQSYTTRARVAAMLLLQHPVVVCVWQLAVDK